MLSPAHLRLTAADFLALPETAQPTELLNGEVFVSPAPLPIHQRVSGRLYKVLLAVIPDGELFYAPIDLVLGEADVVQPDLVWLSAGGACHVREKFLEAPPALIVEILSPGSIRRDRGDKFNLYERAGIQAYWLLDPIELYLEAYRLENGRCVREGVYGPDDVFTPRLFAGRRVDLKPVFDNLTAE